MDNQLVIYNENGEISEVNFERVDMDKPATILSLCEEEKTCIGNILDSTAELSVATVRSDIDDKLISSITSFDMELEEADKQNSKKKLPVIGGAISSAKKMLAKMGNEKYIREEKLASYSGRYEEYCHRIEEIVKAIERQKQSALSDIDLRDKISAEIKPYIEQMELKLNVAKQDKKAYDDETTAMTKLEQTHDLMIEISRRQQFSEILAKKINENEKALILYKDQLQQYRIQQGTDMKLVMENDSFIEDVAPILKAQGSVMLFNRGQAERLKTMESVMNAANVALVKNAQELEANATAAVNLSINGNITVDTLKSLDDSLRNGINVFKNGRIKQREQIEKEQADLKKLKDSLAEYQQEVLNLIDNREVISSVINESSRGINSPKTRRLTNNH